RLVLPDLPDQERFPSETASAFAEGLRLNLVNADQLVAMDEDEMTCGQCRLDPLVKIDFLLQHDDVSKKDFSMPALPFQEPRPAIHTPCPDVRAAPVAVVPGLRSNGSPRRSGYGSIALPSGP